MGKKNKALSKGTVKHNTRLRGKRSHSSISYKEPAERPPKSSKMSSKSKAPKMSSESKAPEMSSESKAPEMSSESKASTKDNGCVRCKNHSCPTLNHKKKCPFKNCLCEKCNDTSDSISIVLDDSTSNSESEIQNPIPFIQSTAIKRSGAAVGQSLRNLEAFLFSKDDNLHNVLMWTAYAFLKESQFDTNLAFAKLSEAQTEVRSLCYRDPSFMSQYGFYPWSIHSPPAVSSVPIPMPYVPLRFQNMSLPAPNMSYATTMEQPVTLAASGQQYMWSPAANSEGIPLGAMAILIPQQQGN